MFVEWLHINIVQSSAPDGRCHNGEHVTQPIATGVHGTTNLAVLHKLSDWTGKQNEQQVKIGSQLDSVGQWLVCM